MNRRIIFNYCKKSFFISFIILSSIILSHCTSNEMKDKNENKISTLNNIKEKRKIVALTGYNAYSYFIYRGRPMGFEYDLLKRFGDYLGVDIELKVVKDLNDMFTKLKNREGDLIAFNLTVTKDREKNISFTNPLNYTKQILVQRRPENWRQMRVHTIEKQLLRNPIKLEGKTVYIRSGSVHKQRLLNLSNEIGGDINIVVADKDLNTEDLIRMVAEGEIDYCVADENIAMLTQTYYPNIDIGTQISLQQKIGWAVNKQSQELLNELNKWILQEQTKPDFYVIYEKYYRNRTTYKSRLESEYFSNTGGKLSEYDDILQEYSQTLNWDWRILASLIYQESKFDPNAKSWAGAVGLMQLMPETANDFGAINLEDAKESLKAGISYLVWLDDYWKKYIGDKDERIKFVLASYNIGYGHVEDAFRLAQKYNANPYKWDGNVADYLAKKSNSKYFNDEVVRNGYCSGIETINYVKEIITRYEQYKQFIS